jgi:hypothetical protein
MVYGYTQALMSLYPTAEWSMTDVSKYSTLVWYSTDIPKPSDTVLQDEITKLTVEEPFNVCIAKAKTLLADSDWSVLPDVNISNKAEFEAYRAQLRTLMFNPVESPVFPTEPQPAWI